MFEERDEHERSLFCDYFGFVPILPRGYSRKPDDMKEWFTHIVNRELRNHWITEDEYTHMIAQIESSLRSFMDAFNALCRANRCEVFMDVDSTAYVIPQGYKGRLNTRSLDRARRNRR